MPFLGFDLETGAGFNDLTILGKKWIKLDPSLLHTKAKKTKYALKYKVRYLGPYNTGLGVALKGNLHDALLTLVEKG